MDAISTPVPFAHRTSRRPRLRRVNTHRIPRAHHCRLPRRDCQRHLQPHIREHTRRIAQTGNMARKSNVDSDGPSTADASANEDVEMQDQDTKMSGFKKFGVCPFTSDLFPAPRRGDGRRNLSASPIEQQTNSAVAVLPGYARLHSTFTAPSRAAPPVQSG